MLERKKSTDIELSVLTLRLFIVQNRTVTIVLSTLTHHQLLISHQPNTSLTVLRTSRIQGTIHHRDEKKKENTTNESILKI